MKENKLPYLLPIRSGIFLLVFVIGSFITGKELTDMVCCTCGTNLKMKMVIFGCKL